MAGKEEPKRKFNAGLCAMPYYVTELFQDKGLLTPATSMANLAMLSCVACHFRREKPVSGMDIIECTGLNNGVVYPALRGMKENEQIISGSPARNGAISYWPVSEGLLSMLAAELQVPGACAEVRPPDERPAR